MKNRILLTRGEHEVYFIPFPPRLLCGRRFEQFVSEKLRELHPGFSSSSVFDARKIRVKNRGWIMATVMEKETLTEKRILNPRSAFFTATSLLVHTVNFTSGPAYNPGGETIGYDPVSDAPFSIPADGNKTADTGTIQPLLKSAPRRYQVFGKKSRLAVFAPFALLVIAVCAALALGVRRAPSRTAGQEEHPLPLQEQELQAVPSSVSLLAGISQAVVQAKGIILDWQYNEQNTPALVVNISGMEPARFFSIVGGFDYLCVDGISGIQYTEGKPAYTVSLSFDTSRCRVPVAVLFGGREPALAFLESFRAGISGLRLAVLSETLPAGVNGGDLCAVTLTCAAADLVSALALVENRLAADSLRIQTHCLM